MHRDDLLKYEKHPVKSLEHIGSYRNSQSDGEIAQTMICSKGASMVRWEMGQAASCCFTCPRNRRLRSCTLFYVLLIHFIPFYSFLDIDIFDFCWILMLSEPRCFSLFFDGEAAAFAPCVTRVKGDSGSQDPQQLAVWLSSKVTDVTAQRLRTSTERLNCFDICLVSIVVIF